MHWNWCRWAAAGTRKRGREYGSKRPVALAGARDALELVQMGGCWYTEEGQRVRLEEAWGDRVAVPLPHEEDFLCQPQLAAYLIGLLGTDSQVPAPLLWQSAGSSPQTLVS
jgi:hypothetical protein